MRSRLRNTLFLARISVLVVASATQNASTQVDRLADIIDAAIEQQLPSTWDIRAQYPLCRGWYVHDQTKGGSDGRGCAQCCPMAFAAALSVKECISGGRNAQFSAQQIWDCSGEGIADCAEGVRLNTMLNAIGEGPYSPYNLVPGICAPELNAAPNASRCMRSMLQCPRNQSANASLPFFSNARAQGLISVDVLNFRGPAEYHAIQNAMHGMMLEILMHGPVVAVFTLADDDILRFSNWRRSVSVVFSVSAPGGGSPPITERHHCIMVYGWGASAGLPLWRAQNSYGVGWGDRGLISIERGVGLLETAWRSISAVSRGACAAADAIDEPCLPLPYGDYRTKKVALPQAVDTTQMPFSRTSPATVVYSPISNTVIVVIAFSSALVVTLLVMGLHLTETVAQPANVHSSPI